MYSTKLIKTFIIFFIIVTFVVTVIWPPTGEVLFAYFQILLLIDFNINWKVSP